jgi:hypothetical protein
MYSVNAQDDTASVVVVVQVEVAGLEAAQQCGLSVCASLLPRPNSEAVFIVAEIGGTLINSRTGAPSSTPKTLRSFAFV